MEPNGEGDQLTQYAKLTALKPGTATVTAKAKNGTATYDLAVTVTEATGSGTFNIVGDTLVSYSGTESTVTIPDGVRVIGENAFKNNDYILNVICPRLPGRRSAIGRSTTATTCRASACLRR